jgi:hypothetical protein
MYRTVSKRAAFALTILLAATPRAVLHAQQAGVVSSEISMSRERAEIKLELDNGRKLTLAMVSGPAAAGAQLRRDVTGSGDQMLTLPVRRGDAADRAWRELLNNAMDANSAALAPMLSGWNAPAQAASFQRALAEALSGVPAALATPAGPAAPAAPAAPGLDDSLSRLENRVEVLQEQLDEARGDAIANRHRGPAWLSPLRHVVRGISGIFATLITYAVLFGLGFVTIMFGGRKYIEGVADTARAGIGRSFLVGLAGSFLLLPVFVLGIIALAISIVGIPALLIWIPLFPLGALAAAVLGFIGVAHAAGESWAERKYAGAEWVSRANSYYFIATGLALMSSLFIAAHVITMAGPWLGFINNILNFFGIMLTWAAITTGFGAVLISRGGKRVAGRADAVQSSLFTEDANV